MKFVVIKKRTLIACTSLFAVIMGVAFTASSPAFGKSRKIPIYSVGTDEKKVAISFDCAWGTEYTDSLLQTMAEKDVKCTFFSVEFWTKKNAE